jgi:tetratricopeptide (TPR) repeat protein
MDWDRYQEAVRLGGTGKLEESLAELQKLAGTSTEPDENEVVLFAVAHCLRNLHHYEDARQCILKVYATLNETSPTYPYVIFLEASIDEDTKNFEQALSKFDLILEKYPAVLTDPYYDDLSVWIPGMRGITLAGLKRYSEARPLLEKAIREDYLKERMVFYLAACCYELKDFAQAQRYFTESLALDMTPEYKAMARFYLAMTFLAQRQFAPARQEFEWCFQHQDRLAIRQDRIIGGLVRALEGLGLQAEANRYSNMLRIQ